MLKLLCVISLSASFYQRVNRLENMFDHVQLTGPQAFQLCDLLSSYHLPLPVSQNMFLTVTFSSPPSLFTLMSSAPSTVTFPTIPCHPVHVEPSNF